jgi:hypothetical protein
VSGEIVGPLLWKSQINAVHVFVSFLPKRLRITSITLPHRENVTLLNNALALNNSGNDRSSGSGVVSRLSRLRVLDLGTQDRGSGDSQGSVDVDSLGKGGGKAKKGGGGEGVTHLEVGDPGYKRM